jgi:putative oxidoreductase
MGFMSRLETPAYALLRFLAGSMFALHGAQKILGFLAQHEQPAMFSQMWFGGIIELVGGALIAVGLLTRIAAFISSGTMAVAYLQFHWPVLAFETANWKWLPTVNGGEPAVLYCFLFLLVCARGPGPISLDRLFRIDRPA